jgi:hypothetical protein
MAILHSGFPRLGSERVGIGSTFWSSWPKSLMWTGVIWYQLMYCESYKLESYYFPEILRRETGLPMLTVESDYDAAEVGPLRMRLEIFVESLRR